MNYYKYNSHYNTFHLLCDYGIMSLRCVTAYVSSLLYLFRGVNCICVQCNTVCAQICVGLYFCKFHESTGDRENKNAKNIYTYSTSLLLQAAIRKIKIARGGVCEIYIPQILYAYGTSHAFSLRLRHDVITLCYYLYVKFASFVQRGQLHLCAM